ncbi:hypothetical protein OHC33_000963 [Knufia fluminis]|uniref:BTB domain-containing protein n=1 Tax=Knufia fluminis TaxID=191047 RepID=A0AAN8EKH9_9EURO|nr:hypothetical protein OHC33_000963 [Knufia fluminis]
MAFTQSDIVTIYVGPTRQRFTAHKDLLCAKPEYFRASLNGRWTESTSNVLNWNDEDDTVEVVKTMMTWLYGNRLDIENVDHEHLINCYHFAHKRLLLDFQNKLVDTLRASLKKREECLSIEWPVDENLLNLDATPLYSFMIQSVIWHMMQNKEEYIEGGEDADDTAVQLGRANLGEDLVKGMLRYLQAPYKDPVRWKGCHFHDHSDGSHCGRRR